MKHWGGYRPGTIAIRPQPAPAAPPPEGSVQEYGFVSLEGETVRLILGW